MLSVTAVEGAENRKKNSFTVPLCCCWLYTGLIHQLLALTVTVRIVVVFLDTTTTCFEHMAHGVVKDVCDGQMCTFSSPCEKSSLSLSVMYTLRCHIYIYIYIWKHIHHIYIYITYIYI